MTEPDRPIPVSPVLAGQVPLYREQGQAQPKAIRGQFRTLKWWATILLLGWWHLGPFLRWDRGEGAPGQAILVDMVGRRAYFLDIQIWPQEVYYLSGLLMIAAISLFLMSALAGRVWCGFLCWQTVYTDLFQGVERLVLGDRNARLAFRRAPWRVGKLLRQALVVAGWMIISALCGLCATLWFGDAFVLLAEIFTLTASSGVYFFIMLIGGFCFLLGGFARERVCVYMCPYSRFQSAMFDEHSLIVSYEAWRGEPRGNAPKNHDFSGRGHCVDCRMCVNSCPTGVDIRFGNQLACIGCGLCIDACNQVMDRLKLPRGLINYDSSANLAARAAHEDPPGRKLIRPRTLVYFALLALIGSVLLVTLASRPRTGVNIIHERSPLFIALSDGSIRNVYTYKILNKSRENQTYSFKIEGLQGGSVEVLGEKRQGNIIPLPVDKDSVGTFRVFVSAPVTVLQGGRQAVTFVLESKDGETLREDFLFIGPDR